LSPNFIEPITVTAPEDDRLPTVTAPAEETLAADTPPLNVPESALIDAAVTDPDARMPVAVTVDAVKAPDNRIDTAVISEAVNAPELIDELVIPSLSLIDVAVTTPAVRDDVEILLEDKPAESLNVLAVIEDAVMAMVLNPALLRDALN